MTGVMQPPTQERGGLTASAPAKRGRRRMSLPWYLAGTALLAGGAITGVHFWDQHTATLRARAIRTGDIKQEFLGEGYPNDIDVKYGGPTGHEVVATIGNKACTLTFEVTGDTPADNPGHPGLQYVAEMQTRYFDTLTNGHPAYRLDTNIVTTSLGHNPNAYLDFVSNTAKDANLCS